MYKRNARPNNNQLITYYLPVCYLLRIQQYPEHFDIRCTVVSENFCCKCFHGYFLNTSSKFKVPSYVNNMSILLKKSVNLWKIISSGRSEPLFNNDFTISNGQT